MAPTSRESCGSVFIGLMNDIVMDITHTGAQNIISKCNRYTTLHVRCEKTVVEASAHRRSVLRHHIKHEMWMLNRYIMTLYWEIWYVYVYTHQSICIPDEFSGDHNISRLVSTSARDVIVCIVTSSRYRHAESRKPQTYASYISA